MKGVVRKQKVVLESFTGKAFEEEAAAGSVNACSSAAADIRSA